MVNPASARQHVPMSRRIELSDDDLEVVDDAVRVLAELDDVAPADMTALFDMMQFDNLRIVVEDLLRLLTTRLDR